MASRVVTRQHAPTRPIVGFGHTQIHPVKYFMNELINELKNDEFEKFKMIMRDKLNNAVWETIDLVGSYNEANEADVFTQKRKFFEALQNQYYDVDMLTIIQNIAKQENFHIDHGTVSLASAVEDVLQQVKNHEAFLKNELPGLSSNFVGREKYVTEIRSELEKKSARITGVIICGMFGMGKTCLAAHICKILHMKEYVIRCVDLRKAQNVYDVYKEIMNKLGRIPSDKYEPHHLYNALNETIHTKTIILLDNADDVMDKNEKTFEIFLKNLTRQQNNKVKLLITCRYKLVDSLMSEVGRFKTKRLDGAISEYELGHMTQNDSVSLISTLHPDLMSRDCMEQLGHFCGYCPLAVILAVSYLKQSNSSYEEIDRLLQTSPVTPVTPGRQISSPAAFSFHNLITDRTISDANTSHQLTIHQILKPIFRQLDKKWQTMLIALSMFETSFDVKAAKHLTGTSRDTDMFLDLQFLKSKHLIEADALTELENLENDDVVDFFDKENVSFCFHPVVFAYFQQQSRRTKWSEFKVEIEKKYKEYFFRKLEDAANKGRSDAFESYKMVSKQEKDFRKALYLYHQNTDGYNQKVHTERNFALQNEVCLLLERFQHEEERAVYFATAAKDGKEKGNAIKFSFFKLWEVQQYIRLGQQWRVDECIPQIKRSIQTLKKSDQMKSIPSINSVIMLLDGFLGYTEARICEKAGESQKALNHLKDSYTTFKNILKDDFFTARIRNMMGKVYHILANLPESLKCHDEAFEMLRTLVKGNMHYDLPIFLCNIATVYHKMFMEKYDKRKDAVGKLSKSIKRECETNYQKAKAYYEQSIELSKRQHCYDTPPTANTLRNKAFLLNEKGEVEEALRCAQEAQTIYLLVFPPSQPESIGIKWLIGFLIMQQGDVCHGLGKLEEALKLRTDAERLFDEVLKKILSCKTLQITSKDYCSLKEDFQALLEKLGKDKKWLVVKGKFLKYEQQANSSHIGYIPARPQSNEEDESDNESKTVMVADKKVDDTDSDSSKDDSDTSCSTPDVSKNNDVSCSCKSGINGNTACKCSSGKCVKFAPDDSSDDEEFAPPTLVLKRPMLKRKRPKNSETENPKKKKVPTATLR